MNHVSQFLVRPHKVEKCIASKIVSLMNPDCYGFGELIGLEYAQSHKPSYCATLINSPDVVLAPVMVKGLYQAASESNPDLRYWVDQNAKMRLHSISDVRMAEVGSTVNSNEFGQLKPALPIVTDYLFNQPLNHSILNWGGSIDGAFNLICASGIIGHHAACETRSGVILLTPNTFSINHWQTGSKLINERHVIEADFATNDLIYWTQHRNIAGHCSPRIEKRIEYSPHLMYYLPPEVRTNYPAIALSHQGLISKLAIKANPGFTFEPITKQFININAMVGDSIIDAETYNMYQLGLIRLLNAIQQFPIISKTTGVIDSELAFEILPEAHSTCVQLIFNDSLDLKKMVSAAQSVIKTINDYLRTPNIVQICNSSEKPANEKSMFPTGLIRGA